MKKYILIFTGIILLNVGLGYIINTQILDANFILKYASYTTTKLVFIGILIVLISKMHTKLSLFKRNLYIIPLLGVLLYLSFTFLENKIIENNLNVTIAKNLLFLFFCLSVGFFEELLFRVYFFQKLLVNKVPNFWKATIITTLLFALVHSFNLIKADYSILGVFFQIFFAFIMGIIFQALFIRFKNVFLIGTLHGIVNYFGTYRSRLFQIETATSKSAFIWQEFFINLGIAAVVIFLALSLAKWLIGRSTITNTIKN